MTLADVEDAAARVKLVFAFSNKRVLVAVIKGGQAAPIS